MAFFRAVAASGTSLQGQIEQAFDAKDITTPEMQAAIEMWFDLYYLKERTKKQDPSQRIPFAVVNKISRAIFSEFNFDPSVEFVKSTLNSLEVVRKRAMQQTLIGGECLIKPVFNNGNIEFSVIARRNYRVFGRKSTGEVTDVGTMESTSENGYFFRLLERRTVDDGGYLTIVSKLYRSQSDSSLGTNVPLSTLPKYAELEETITFQKPVGSVGLIYVKTPMENCVDDSADGVSIYEPAVGLIRIININEAQINGEFERGESRIVVSGDMMQVDESGERRFKDSIFVGLPDDPDSIGVTIFSPAFREQSFLTRKTEYLRNVESLIGLKRGILSEVEAAERTATEVTSSAGDYNLTLIDFQEMWKAAMLEAVRLCSVLGAIYQGAKATNVKEDDMKISFGNGILYDEDKEWAQYKEMVAMGLIKPEIAIAWRFDLPFPKTEAELMTIRQEYMPQIEDLTDVDTGAD